MGTPEGSDERYVVIAKRSFRGAGPWRVRGDVLVISGKRDVEQMNNERVKTIVQGDDEEMFDVNADDSRESDDEDGDQHEDEDEDEEEDKDGEVEIMWDTDGSRYQLMRDPPEEFGDIRKETHWVNTRYFS